MTPYSFVTNNLIMISFINKVVERTSDIKENNKALVIFDGTKLQVKYQGELFELFKYNDVAGTIDRYSSPANNYYPLWTKKVSSNKYPSHIEKVNLVWWRYKPGMRLSGTVKDNTFYPR